MLIRPIQTQNPDPPATLPKGRVIKPSAPEQSAEVLQRAQEAPARKPSPEALERARERTASALAVVAGAVRDLEPQLADMDFYVHVLHLRAEDPAIAARLDALRDELERVAPVLARVSSLTSSSGHDGLEGHARELYDAVYELRAIRDRLWVLVNAFNEEVGCCERRDLSELPSLELTMSPRGNGPGLHVWKRKGADRVAS